MSQMASNNNVMNQSHYKNYSNRLATFTNWTYAISPEALAENGFYHFGYLDTVRCAFCKLEIGSFDPDDVVHQEHFKYSPMCPYLDILKCKDAPSPAKIVIEPPRYPEFASEKERLDSFRTWPPLMPIKPEQLAEAGFFYTGFGDKTKCFYCAGGVWNWELNDDPWEQHAIWFGNCTYVKIIKGQNFIQKVITESRLIKENNKTNDNTILSTTPDDEFKYSEDAEDADKDYDENKLCVICCHEKRNVAFDWCGHVVVCAKCVLKCKNCPICRRSFESVIKLYFC
ncbi:inhibitor of apoptosis protein 3 [Adoxophyes honmai nucleopolyhedrovirus]|uniref:Inhibitor of apoptosis protein 3 n=1 Tax=Adoxophyes honmai nucleopolyhedrovirus TaxID=224399 RepID=Q80LK8_NPVAH|nr:inhibitor of apoptosis protein 3 [Adoxophyes honmai nucleopolyhedrovirus]BAC67339.1 inhibitor of apoptosis protein 3 [Adoxophyes honmai nucleopolyhedrovirus]